MKIYIPSLGRADRQKTFSYLPKAVQEKATYIVVPKSEVKDYTQAGYGANLLIHPDGLKIAGVRQWIVEQHLKRFKDPRIVMADDDLDFFVRRKDHPGRFLTAKPSDVARLLKVVHEKLGMYAHVSVASREQGHRLPPYETHMLRSVRFLAYDASVMAEEGVRFDRVPVMEDFDVALQLLRKAYASCTVTEFLQGQGKSNEKGGCSTFRTPEMQDAAAHKLAELHPGVVKVVQRKTKTGWFGGEGVRTDVRIQWQQAYEEGLKYRTSLVEVLDTTELEED